MKECCKSTPEVIIAKVSIAHTECGGCGAIGPTVQAPTHAEAEVEALKAREAVLKHIDIIEAAKS